MGTVHRLPTLTERSPHLAGPARCHQCGHEWTAVVPVGVIELECPECNTMKGLLIHGCEPKAAWVCGCGCYMFMISPNGVICWKCGEYQVGY